MQCIAQARDCARTVSGVAQPGRQYQENINFSLFCLIPWMLREKCNTSLSQAIPVPNSSLYIICWFIINRLPLQFWSRYFLWINVGLPPPPPPLQSHCLQTFMSQRQKTKHPCKPWKCSSLTSGVVRGARGVISGLLLEIPLGDLLSFAFPRPAHTQRLHNVPFISD